MKKYKLKLIAIMLFVMFLFTLGGCENEFEDKINNNSASENILNSLYESLQQQESSLVSSSAKTIAEDISFSSVVAESSQVTADSMQTVNSSVNSANDISSTGPIHNAFVSAETQKFIDWVENGGDSIKENQAFLSAVKEKCKILIPIAKNSELKEYSNDVADNAARYMMHWIIGDDTDTSTSKLFGNTITFLNEEDKKAGLKELFIKYVSSVENSEDIKTGMYKEINYAYTDFAADEKGNRLHFSRACFVVDDFLVCLFIGHSIGEKPFDPEYLDYFDYEIVNLNVQN